MEQGAGRLIHDERATPGEPILRWSSRATSIEGIQRELASIWAAPRLVAVVSGTEERHVAARTSVMNLVVIARTPEAGERAASTISRLAGRHPSRILVVSSRDPDGPSWLRAEIQAHCILPRADSPETCAEMIHLLVGGDAGRHLDAVVAPLLVHDLPVTLWWPGEPPFGSPFAHDLFTLADRLVVDGSTWGGDGLGRLVEMTDLLDIHGLTVSDFALVRQSRWREAIASVFDAPDLLPYLRYMRRIAVTYGIHEGAAVEATNVIKPVYHVAWLGARLGMRVVEPLARRPARRARTAGRGLAAVAPAGPPLVALLEGTHGEVRVTLGPVPTRMPGGTTLRIELLANRRGSELRAVVTAQADSVNVQVWVDGIFEVTRSFLAPRRTDVDLLEEAIEIASRDPIAPQTIRFAADLARGPQGGLASASSPHRAAAHAGSRDGMAPSGGPEPEAGSR